MCRSRQMTNHKTVWMSFIPIRVAIVEDLDEVRQTLREALEETPDLDCIDDFADDDIIIVTTGSQGEPMSALTRMAEGTHKQIKIKKGDTVILSSKFIPGNERAITNIINKLYKCGADVIYEKISEIHVSGHAFQEELKLMINLTKPKYFIPIHGEYRHLILHARLARQVGISAENILLAENGQIIEFDKRGGRVRESITTGRILIDGKGIGVKQQVLHGVSEVSGGTRESIGGVTPHKNRSGRRLI